MGSGSLSDLDNDDNDHDVVAGIYYHDEDSECAICRDCFCYDKERDEDDGYRLNGTGLICEECRDRLIQDDRIQLVHPIHEPLAGWTYVAYPEPWARGNPLVTTAFQEMASFYLAAANLAYRYAVIRHPIASHRNVVGESVKAMGPDVVVRRLFDETIIEEIWDHLQQVPRHQHDVYMYRRAADTTGTHIPPQDTLEDFCNCVETLIIPDHPWYLSVPGMTPPALAPLYFNPTEQLEWHAALAPIVSDRENIAYRSRSEFSYRWTDAAAAASADAKQQQQKRTENSEKKKKKRQKLGGD